MSVMRVFGPINSGYSTGMMAYTEHSGSWESEKEIAEGYLNNMGASYGDDGNWGRRPGRFVCLGTVRNGCCHPAPSK